MQSSHVTPPGATRNFHANWEAIGSLWHAWRANRSAETSPGIIGYGTIVLAILLTAILQVLSSLFLDDRTQFLIFIPAVMTAAFVGGFRIGALVTTLSLATTLDSVGELDAGDIPLLANGAAFGVVAIGLSVFGDFLHRSRRDAHTNQRDLTSILETMPGALVVFDEAGTVRRFNRAAEYLFGYSMGDVVGRKVDSLLGNGLGSLSQLSYDMGQPGGLRHQALGLRKDGSRFPVELVLSESRSGGRRYFTGLALDLSERQNAHARLEALQGDMIHASRLRLMGTMASALAHELSQPLSAISNYLKGLKHATTRSGEERPAALTAILDKTADQALRAGQIIGRLRDLVTRGETDRRIESMARLIDEAGALALLGTREHGIQVTFRSDPACDRVLADRVQIQQVLHNLLRNAIEAMAECPRRELTISTATGPDDMMTVRVEDSGSGVARDFAAWLFEPFTTTKRDGMGIGLSISRTIIESHGGRIWHETVSEGGAAFCFTLPRIVQDDPAHVP